RWWARQQNDRYLPADPAKTSRFPWHQRHAMDRKFTCIGERRGRVIVVAGPSSADHKRNIGAGLEQCRSNRRLIAFDRDEFSDDAAVALNRSVYHRPVAVLPSAVTRGLGNE